MTFAQPFHDYEILDRVGAGAMGTVFKARHKKLGRIVALKVLRPSLARDVRYVDRLRREARIVAALNHPNIVTGYDLGEEGGYHYFVMEFVEGKSLRALLSEWGIFPEDQVLKVATQVAAALDHAFQRNVIHRDVKPGNILIDEAGTVKLTDMGLAKGPADLTLTRDGATVGTPQYISPEQARNPQDVDVRSDLYSLGATLYHMATGQPPFRGETMAEVITQVLHEVPIAPRVINRQLSEGLALVIRKLLAKNLRLRYQTPRELLDDLERVRLAQPPQVDESRLSAGETDRPANVWLWSLGIVGAAGLLAAAVWLGMQLNTGRGERSAPDAWVAALRRDLEALPSSAARLARWRVEAGRAPAGTAQELELMQRQVIAELQQAVDAVAVQLQGAQWAAVQTAARDPQRWPSADELIAEHVTRRLLATAGLLREQLPAGVHQQALETAVANIERLVQERDRGLQERGRGWFEVTLPARAEERLRQGDFVAAERIWREGYAGFFDGVYRQPLPERVAPAVRAPLDQAFQRAREQGLLTVDAAEQRSATALQSEAEIGIAALRALPGDGVSPMELRARAARLKEQLTVSYPVPGRFRPAADPWAEVQARFQALDEELALRELEWRQRLADRCIDLAWRAFTDGDADAALAVLGDPQRDPPETAALLASHRAALRSARQTASAVMRALQSAPPPLPGHPRNGGLPLELRVETGADVGAEPRLLAQVAGGSWRSARLLEFHFDDLWQRAQQAAPDVLLAVPRDDLQRGRAVLAMAADELTALASALPGDEDGAFLRDDVWPRLLRVRGEPTGSGVDRALAFKRLREAFERARAADQTRDLEAALALWQAGFAADASVAEAQVAAQAGRWVQREKARQERLQELRRQCPVDARVALRDDGSALMAEVVLPAPTLRGAGEGWQLSGGRLEFAWASPQLSEVDRRRLEVDAGLTTASLHTECDVDLSLPQSEHGQRLYLVEFRGVACAVVATADDHVYAAMVQGEVLRTQQVQAAVRRALAPALDARVRAPTVLPGAVHRLSFVVDVPPTRRAATASIAFDGVELCRETVQVDSARLPTLELYPLQDMAVERVRLSAVEL